MSDLDYESDGFAAGGSQYDSRREDDGDYSGSDDDGDEVSEVDVSEEDTGGSVAPSVGKAPDMPVVSMCSVHKPGNMIEVCTTCSAALALVRPEIVKQLIAPPVSNAVKRYLGRSDVKPPSLVFSASILELAERTFFAGRFRSKTHFNDLVKKFISLPPDQHERLGRDLVSEPMFRKYENERRFRHVFTYKRELSEVVRMLRISQRLIFSMVFTLDNHVNAVRGMGLVAGVAFPAAPPDRVNPNVPKVMPDILAVESTAAVFPVPQLTSALAGVSEELSEQDRARIEANMTVIEDEVQEYRTVVVQQFMSLFSATATAANRLDDLMGFYCDLYSHVDASFRELMRAKMATLFRADVRHEVLGRNSTHKQKSKEMDQGLFGGEARVRSVLGKATKKDDLLRKTIMQPRKVFNREGSGSSSGKRGSTPPATSRSRRSRSRSPHYRSGGSRGGRSSGGGSAKSGSKKSTKNEEEQEHEAQDEEEDERDSPKPKNSFKSGMRKKYSK